MNPMHRLRACRWTVWIALAAMLLGALAPMVSHALARARVDASFMQAVCTGGGTRWVPTEPVSVAATPDQGVASLSTDAPAGQGSVPNLDHCPFCLLIADRLGPLPAASMHFFNAESGLALPDAQALFFASRPPVTLLPRGPPRRT
jgi:hypothetical protein